MVPLRAFDPYLEQVRHRGRFCFFQIERVKTLSEPPVNRSQQFASLLRLALKAHAVTVTSCTLNSWQSVRAAGYSTAAQAEVEWRQRRIGGSSIQIIVRQS